MSASIEIRDESVMRAINELIARSERTRPAMESMGRGLLTQVQLGFRSARDPYGVPWRPVLRGGQPLSDRRLLRDSFTYSASDDRVVVGSNRRVSWRGSTFSLAAIHQRGATVRARHAPYLVFRIGDRWVRKTEVEIPARPMLPDAGRGLPDAWRRSALDAIRQHLRGES